MSSVVSRSDLALGAVLNQGHLQPAGGSYRERLLFGWLSFVLFAFLILYIFDAMAGIMNLFAGLRYDIPTLFRMVRNLLPVQRFNVPSTHVMNMRVGLVGAVAPSWIRG